MIDAALSVIKIKRKHKEVRTIHVEDMTDVCLAAVFIFHFV